MASPAAAAPAKRMPHVDHVGSLLRPQALVEKRFALFAGECTAEEVEALEDAAVPEMVQLQKDVGLTILTDGEVRRVVYNHGMFENLDGMTVIPDRSFDEYMPYLPYIAMFRDMGIKGFTSVKCTGKIRRTKPIFEHEFASLKAHVKPEEVQNIKVTMCGPTWMHLRHGSEFTYDHDVYQTDAEYFADLVQAYREEIRDLYELGCRRIQFDDPGFAFYCSTKLTESMKERGVSREGLLKTHIEVYNAVVADRPDDLIVGIHTCRGNMKGLHFSDGGYEAVAQTLFRDLNVDAFYLEYDTDRAGDLKPLRFVPLDKQVFLGFVTTKNGKLEDKEAIKKRIREAAKIMANGEPERSLEHAKSQLSVSPQCGFASVFEGNPLSKEEERKKLELVVEIAKDVWG